jgi:hypothetical protein
MLEAAPVGGFFHFLARLPLFATGLGVLGLLGWRRKRMAAKKRQHRSIGTPCILAYLIADVECCGCTTYR